MKERAAENEQLAAEVNNNVEFKEVATALRLLRRNEQLSLKVGVKVKNKLLI